MRRAVGSTVALAALLVGAPAASAHPLEVSTARVSLRDAHVEVQAEWDLFLLVGATPTDVATMAPTALEALRRQLEQRLVEETQLRVDGIAAPLVVRGFPSPDELRALGATLSASGREHGEWVRLRFEAGRAFPDAARLGLVLPPGLGPTVITFVQPSTAFTAPGAEATFGVLTAPSPRGWGPLGRSEALVLTLGVGALGLGILIGRSAKEAQRRDHS